MKDKIFLLIGVIVIGWSFYIVLQQPAPAKYQKNLTQPIVMIGNNVIPVEVADTDALRTQGLSERTSLAENHGMLFIFDTPSKYGFWMKDMNFPLDMVWIDEDWQVVGVERLVNPDSYPKIFYPASPIKYVLEINAGEAVKRGIDTGAKVSFFTQN